MKSKLDLTSFYLISTKWASSSWSPEFSSSPHSPPPPTTTSTSPTAASNSSRLTTDSSTPSPTNTLPSTSPSTTYLLPHADKLGSRSHDLRPFRGPSHSPHHLRRHPRWIPLRGVNPPRNIPFSVASLRQQNSPNLEFHATRGGTSGLRFSCRDT